MLLPLIKTDLNEKTKKPKNQNNRNIVQNAPKRPIEPVILLSPQKKPTEATPVFGSSAIIKLDESHASQKEENGDPRDAFERSPSGSLKRNLHNRVAHGRMDFKEKSYQMILDYDQEVKRQRGRSPEIMKVMRIADNLVCLTKEQKNKSNTTQLLRNRSLWKGKSTDTPAASQSNTRENERRNSPPRLLQNV